MTPQQLFDNAVTGLAKQGWERSISSTSVCRYMSDDGKRCAIGHSLREVDCQLFDSMPFGANDVATEMGWPPIPYFYGEVQMAHDAAPTPASMIDNFHAVATKYQLNKAALPPKPGKVD